MQERDATTLSSIIEAFKIVCPENLKIGDPTPNTSAAINMVHTCMHTNIPVSSAVLSSFFESLEILNLNAYTRAAVEINFKL